jgi:hypothetical protein
VWKDPGAFPEGGPENLGGNETLDHNCCSTTPFCASPVHAQTIRGGYQIDGRPSDTGQMYTHMAEDHGKYVSWREISSLLTHVRSSHAQSYVNVLNEVRASMRLGTRQTIKLGRLNRNLHPRLRAIDRYYGKAKWTLKRVAIESALRVWRRWYFEMGIRSTNHG